MFNTEMHYFYYHVRGESNDSVMCSSSIKLNAEHITCHDGHHNRPPPQPLTSHAVTAGGRRNARKIIRHWGDYTVPKELLRYADFGVSPRCAWH